ncbi:MAG: hypothetical protein IKB87_00010 [Clostridia bacterium]|nr:hypothetical protein [Clostridia bacterium]
MKRIITLVVALVMVLSIVPFAVSAADIPEAKWGASVDDLGGEGREGTFAEALTAAEASTTATYIQLQKDITIASTNVKCAGSDITLDLNGYDVTGSGSIAFRVRGTSGNTFIITDTYTGSERASCVSAAKNNAPLYLQNGSTINLTINGGTFEGPTYAIEQNNKGGFGALTINDGTFIGGTYALVMYDADLTVNGGTFTAKTAGIALNKDTASVDFNGNDNPNGISVYTKVAVPAENIVLPEAGFSLFSGDNKFTGSTTTATATYTVKGAPVAPPPSEDEGTEDAVAVLEGIVPSETVAAKVAPEAKPGAKAPALRAPKAPAKGIAARTARPKF